MDRGIGAVILCDKVASSAPYCGDELSTPVYRGLFLLSLSPSMAAKPPKPVPFRL